MRLHGDSFYGYWKRKTNVGYSIKDKIGDNSRVETIETKKME